MNEQVPKLEKSIGWKLPLAVFTLAHVVGTIHSTAVTVMVPVIKTYYDVPYTAVALLITWYSIGQTVSSIPNGNMVDRLGVRKSLLISQGLLLFAAVLLTVASSIWIAYLSLFLMGWGYSGINPATAKGIFQTFSATRRGTAVGLKQAGVPLGGVLAGVLGGIAVAQPAEATGWNLHWQTIMAIVSGLTIAGLALCFALPAALSQPAEPSEKRSLWRDMGLLLRDGPFNRFVLSTMFFNFGQYNFFTFLTAFLTRVLGTTQEVAGGVYSVVQAVSAVARPFWAYFSDFFLHSRKRVLCICLCFVAVLGFAACAVISHAGAPVWIGIAVSIVLGATIASYPPLAQVMAAEAVDPRMIGSGIGYAHMGTHIGACLGPIIMGGLLDLYDYDIAYGVTATVVLAGVALLTFGFREGRAR